MPPVNADLREAKIYLAEVQRIIAQDLCVDLQHACAMWSNKKAGKTARFTTAHGVVLWALTPHSFFVGCASNGLAPQKRALFERLANVGYLTLSNRKPKTALWSPTHKGREVGFAEKARPWFEPACRALGEDHNAFLQAYPLQEAAMPMRVHQHRYEVVFRRTRR